MSFCNYKFPFTRETFVLFLVFFSVNSTFGQSMISENMKNAQEAFARMDAKDAYTDNLNHVDMNMLPSGFKQTINNMDVTVAISGAEFHPDHTSLEAFLRVVIPGDKKKTFFFGAKDIRLSLGGDIIGDAKLVLLEDLDIPMSGENIILRLKGGFDKKTGQSANLTYASIDCKGLKAIGLSAEVELSSKICYPVNAYGDSIPGAKVVGQFQTEIENWNDIVASVSFPSFSLNGLKDFIWTLDGVIFDYSDLKNAPDFTFPEGYDQYIIPGKQELWQGIYARNLSVGLPAQFAKEDQRRVTISARDLLIDDNGVTGKFGVENILSLDEGNASGWAFSVDYLALELMASRLEGFIFNGALQLPISEKTRLKYNGFMNADDQYVLQIASFDKISFDMLNATAELDPNSYVEFKSDKGKFKPEAMLHGRMGIYVSMDDNKNKTTSQNDSIESGNYLTQFKGVEFRSLHLKTEVPCLSVEYLGYKGEAKLMNFPISVKDIAMRTSLNEAALGFEIDLSLGTFKGGTRIEIVGRMAEGRLQQWKYSKTEISKIKIAADVAEVFTLSGELDILKNDPTYGDGFGGKLSAKFSEKSPLKGLDVTVRGMFGHTDFHYWFVDGIAEVPGIGVPIGPGINLTGFGGGISYKMKPSGLQSNGGNLLSATSMSYTPDEKSSLGIKAATTFAIPKEVTVHGEACFELSFNNKGGLSYAGFYGYAKVLEALPIPKQISEKYNYIAKKYNNIVKRETDYLKGNEGLKKALEKSKQYAPNEAAAILTASDSIQGNGFTASLGIQFNFAESSFHANFDLYANILGGIIRGSGRNNRAGYAVLHIDPNDWYMYMGTPTDRIGLKMGIGKILSVETGSYLMLGTKIPEAPGVPSQVASVLGYSPKDLDYMKNLNQIGDGKGFAFGSSLSVNTGDLTFLILYANYSAGLGFDIMLKDYGDAQCKGHSGAIGMNGWYANGQAYAYMHGELGVKINLWFMKAKIPIFSADIGALMQAKLPNPSSFKAYLAVKAKVLGLVSVNCRFKITIGDECELIIPGGSPLDMLMISDLSPTDKLDEVSVFTAPQATFNMAIGKAFDVQDDEGEKTYRIQLKDFVLNDGQNVTGKLKWSRDMDVASFYAHEILSPEKDITATVRVVFEELKNGRWNQVYTAGKEAVESKVITFKTGDAPKDIPLENIVYSYPVVNQQYFLADESNKGYVQLEFGQNYLFPTNLKNQVLVEDATGSKQYVDFKYNESLRRIDFSMPRTINTNSYKLQIASLSTEGGVRTTNDVDSKSLLNDEQDGNISVDSKKASAETRTDVGAVLLTYDFKTSAYNTFKQKVESIDKLKPIASIITSDLLMFGYSTTNMEPFDLAELTGIQHTSEKPLVDVTATLDDYFYREKIYPLIYKDYPTNGEIYVTRENVEEIGIPPVKALPIRTQYLNRIEQNDYNGFVKQYFPYQYNLPAVYKEDFIDLQHQVINRYYNNGQGGEAYKRFLSGRYPFISSEYYKMKMQYVMPGDIKGTSAIFDFYNFVK